VHKGARKQCKYMEKGNGFVKLEVKKFVDSQDKKRSRKTSIIEGSFSAFSSGAGDNYIIPFARELLSKPFQIGILNAFPGFLGPLAQFFGSRIMERQSRKSIVTRFAFLQALMWIPIGLIGILFWMGWIKGSAPFLLVIGYSLLVFFGNLAGPAWFSWMGDIIPERQRGKYFSRRNRITGTFGMIAFLLGAFLLDFFKTKGFVLIAFFILFSVSSVCRMMGFVFFSKQHEPKLILKKEEYYFSFWQFLRRYSNFTKFSIYMAAFHFAMALGGPFFVLYMLQELKFSYITYMAVSLSATVFYLILAPYTGKFSDKYGNNHLIYIASILFSIYPILWILFRTPIKLIFITQLIGGVATAAFAIGTTNFIYDTITPQRRALCISYMHILIGIGIFFGSLLGGFILNYAHPSNISPFIFLFSITGILRAVTSVVFFSRVKEIKTYKVVPKPLMYALHPFKLIQSQFVWVKNQIDKL